MDKKIKKYLLAISAILSFGVTGCSNNTEDAVDPEIKENIATIEIQGAPVDGTFEYTFTENKLQLTAKVTFSGKEEPYTILWSSSREAVATVNSNGLVTFVGNGEVTIFAKLKDKNVSQGVKIKAKNNQTGRTVPTSLTIKNKPIENYSYNANNSSIQLLTECMLSTGVTGTWDLLWTTTDENIVTVNSTGLMQIVADGTATIKVACKDFENVCDSFTIITTINTLAIKNLPADNTLDLYNLTPVTLSFDSDAQLEGTPVWTSSNENVATIDADGKITPIAIGKTSISLEIAGLRDSFDLVVVDTDPAWADVSNVDLNNCFVTGTDFYDVSTVKKSNYTFLDPDANVGIKISKNNTDDIEGKFLFKSNLTLKANAQYILSFGFEKNDCSASPWGGLRLGIKNVLSSVECPGYQPSLYDYTTNGKYKVADEGKTYPATYVCSEDAWADKACYTKVDVKFITGNYEYENVNFELSLNFGANDAEYILTKMKVEETLYSQYSREDLSGMLAADAMKHGSASYKLTEITSGFISGNTSARCGLHFEKTGTINEYSDYEFNTNVKLEANTQYKMIWIVDRYAGHTSAYSALRVGLKGIFKSSEGSFPMSGWDCNNKKIEGLNGVTGNSSSYSEVNCGSEGYIFTETATFTTGENAIDEVIVEINLNYQGDQGSKCAITRLVIEKVVD